MPKPMQKNKRVRKILMPSKRRAFHFCEHAALLLPNKIKTYPFYLSY